MQPQKPANFSLQPSVQFWGSIILSHTMPYPNGCGSLIQCPNNSKVHKCSQQFGIRFVFGFREGQMSSGYLSPVHLMPFPVPKARWLLNHLLHKTHGFAKLGRKTMLLLNGQMGYWRTPPNAGHCSSLPSPGSRV